MKSITPQNARKLAVWLAVHDPATLAVLAQKGRQSAARRAGLSSFPRFAGRGLGRFGDTVPAGGFGTGAVTTPISTTAPAGSTGPAGGTGPLDLSLGSPSQSFSTGPALQSIGLTAAQSTTESGITTQLQSIGATAAQSAGSTAVTVNLSAGNTSPGFWSSLASGIGSAASSVGSDLASAGRFLTSPQGISTVAALAAAGATTYAAVNASNNATKVQLARVAAGQSPAPISYDSAGNPAYYGANGVTPLSGAQLSSLAPTNMLPWLLIGGGLLLLVLLS